MISNSSSLVSGLIIGLVLGVIAFLQSIVIWQKQGFAIIRAELEKKIASKYRKTSKSNISLWTQYSIYALLIVFIFLISSQIVTKVQIIIFCFSFVFSFVFLYGFSAFFSDRILRKNK